MNAIRNIRPYILACSLILILQPLQAATQSATDVSQQSAPRAATARDGQHDFDFEIGTWKTHLRRLQHPLTGSTTWIEYQGTSVVRKIWDGRANLVELEVDGPTGHVEGLSLRLYDPQAHQWSLNFANSRGGTLSVPTIGEFKNGRGEFYDQEPYNGRTILVRNVWSDITANSCHFEQAFSDDGGKTWEVNWIADDARVPDANGAPAAKGEKNKSSGAAAGPSGAQEISSQSSGERQSLSDAWWTGPMLANSAATLPRGHFLIEPYLYDVTSAHSHGFGSLTYIQYGLVDRLTVGVIPTAGYNKVSDGVSSSSVGMGDVALLAQYRLTQFHPGSWLPTMSIEVQQSFPTGKYDQLGNRPSDGFGSGTYTTTLALDTQTYFWLSNRRILRMRLNVSKGFSSSVNVDGVSVYGTAAGFRGRAWPGSAFFVDSSWEYSLTRSWVLALDVTYRHVGNTPLTGYEVSNPQSVPHPPGIHLDSGTTDAFGFAPAIEYSWKPNLGVLLGTRIIPASRNTTATITPAVAINFVR